MKQLGLPDNHRCPSAAPPETCTRFLLVYALPSNRSTVCMLVPNCIVLPAFPPVTPALHGTHERRHFTVTVFIHETLTFM